VSDPTPPVFTLAWLAPSDVKAWLRLDGTDTADDALVHRCCAQTELYVQRCRPDMFSTLEPYEYSPDAEVYSGAVMYAAREYRRRNSPAGIEMFGDGGSSFVSKYDPDIERCLRTGSWTAPAVG
jgi:hypothetical protein